MAISRSACALAVLAVLLAAAGAEAHRGYGHGYNKAPRDYLVQGQSRFSANRPKDPTPLAPTTAGPYAIAHRGSSGELPEETREDYEQAIALGADFIEGDTVLTRDGHLICRHEPNLSNTTNADDLFPDRRRTYTIDFAQSVGVHAIDLDLSEIRQLRARQRLFARDQSYNDMFKIITLEEYLDICINAQRVVGAYIETKHPKWHDSFNLAALNGKTMTQRYLEIIKSKGYGGKLNSKRWLQQPIFLQSFETFNLKYLRPRTDLPLVQLTMGVNTAIPDLGTGNFTPTGGSIPGRLYGDVLIDTGLKEIASYADAIGPDKGSLVPLVGGKAVYTTDLATRAHKAGLQIHPYTFRNEQVFFATNLVPSTIMSEYELYIQELGVDGVFADYIEGLVFYLRFRRQNSQFPKAQTLPQVSTATNPNATP